jgi:hypothetical protein
VATCEQQEQPLMTSVIDTILNTHRVYLINPQ